jgi:hypothetical protein
VDARMPWQHKTDDSDAACQFSYSGQNKNHNAVPSCRESFNFRCRSFESTLDNFASSFRRLSSAKTTSWASLSSAASIIWHVLASSSTFCLCWRNLSIASSNCLSKARGFNSLRTFEFFCPRIVFRNSLQRVIISRYVFDSAWVNR